MRPYTIWAAVVNRFGAICVVVKVVNSATNNTEAVSYPGSRVISV